MLRYVLLLQAAKAGGANPNMGIDGIKGVLADMTTLGVWDTFAVKVQTLKTAIEVCVRVCSPILTVGVWVCVRVYASTLVALSVARWGYPAFVLSSLPSGCC